MKLTQKLDDRLRRIEAERSASGELHAIGVDAVEYARAVGFEPDEWQADVLRWQGKRLLLNCARQSGKSTIASLIAVYQAIHMPDSLILLVSPSLRQSSELFRKVSDWFGRVPDMPALTEDNKLSATLSNGSRIVSLPSSQSTIRGFSAVDLLIEDEAAHVDDDLYRAVRPMLAVSNGRMILMSTPWGQRGHFYEEWRDGGDVWRRFSLKATDNPRITPAFLDEERRALGDAWYRSEYLCEFTDTTNSTFRSEDVRNALSGDTPYIPLFGG